ncbi:MAG TPA: M56 family metallopeptidase [Vicinamibacteria bacterium]|nr:M56 family metallopeptidase [Vicinamibacteria bacterium]
MSALELTLRNLAAWSVQVAVLGLAAAALSRLLPIERPAARLAFGQALLAVVLGLPLVQPWHATAPAVTWSLAPAPAPASVAPLATPGGASPSPAIPGWPLAATGLLLLGVSFGLMRVGAGLVRLRSLRRDSRPLDSPPWLLALRDDVAPRARFLLSDAAGTPATFGVRRPIVLLPPAFESMPRERQAAIALHELVHARRADWAVLMAEETLKAVLFFHPAVHWLVARVRLAREQTVDAAVVHRLGNRQPYLESLVEMARFAADARTVPAAPFLRESHLRERVDLLLKEVSMSRCRTLTHLVLTAAALVLAVSWAASAVPLQSAKPAVPDATIAIEDKVTAPSEPKLVRQVRPAYPPDAKAEKVQGLFQIEVVIGKDGAIKDARIVASAPTAERLKELEAKKGTPAATEGDARLAEAALTAVRQWQYQPILKDGKPVEFKATVTVNFKLA